MARPRKITYTVDSDNCWIWNGSVNGNGYGPHRRYYEDEYGKIPNKMTIDHLCRVRRCVNPLHMEVVTYSINLLRKNDVNGCKVGHTWAKENTYINSNGHRMCRTCRAARAREFRARQKQSI